MLRLQLLSLRVVLHVGLLGSAKSSRRVRQTTRCLVPPSDCQGIFLFCLALLQVQEAYTGYVHRCCSRATSMSPQQLAGSVQQAMSGEVPIGRIAGAAGGSVVVA